MPPAKERVAHEVPIGEPRYTLHGHSHPAPLASIGTLEPAMQIPVSVTHSDVKGCFTLLVKLLLPGGPETQALARSAGPAAPGLPGREKVGQAFASRGARDTGPGAQRWACRPRSPREEKRLPRVRSSRG